MKISTLTKEITVRRFTFPDGQPHVTLSFVPFREHVRIKTSLCTVNELFDLLLIKDVLDRGGNDVELYITYFMGARMDRPIDNTQPDTFRIMCNAIRDANFFSITVLDIHNRAALYSHLPHANNVLPLEPIRLTLLDVGANTLVVIPDKGATSRVTSMLAYNNNSYETIQAFKERDPNTGKLTGFTLETYREIDGRNCLIIDDICDGGATFTGLATLLRACGATRISLFVTHGIFSKGLPLEGIDHIYTTNSYAPHVFVDRNYLTVYDV